MSVTPVLFPTRWTTRLDGTYQHGQPAKKLHRVEHDVCRPIGPRLPQREAHLAVGRQGESVGRHGWSQGVAADAFEPIALPCRNDEPRVQVPSMPAGLTLAQGAIDRRTRVFETTDASTCVTPERDEPSHRRRRQAGEDRRLVRPGIHPAILGVAPLITLGEFSAIEQPPDSGLHGRQDLRDVQRRQTPGRTKPDRAGRVACEHAVEASARGCGRSD